MADENLLPADALEKNVPKVIPPLAGFWFRFGALGLDVIALIVALRFTLGALRPFFLSIGSGTIAVVLFMIFLYVFLSEGPVGKGMTPGKFALKIRTTDLELEPLRPTAAAVRAVAILLLTLPLLRNELASPYVQRGDQVAVFWVYLFTWFVPAAYITVNVFLTVLHPLKQGVHDMLAGSVVVREAGAHHLPAYLEQVSEQAPMLKRRAVQMAAAAFVILTVGGAFLNYRELFTPEVSRQYRFMSAFHKEFAFGQFEPSLGWQRLSDLHSGLKLQGFTTATLEAEYRETGIGNDPTTETHLIVFSFASNRPLNPNSISEAEMKRLESRASRWAENVIQRNQYPLDQEHRFRRQADPKTKQERVALIFQPRYVAIVFVEQVFVVLFRSTRVVSFEIAPLSLPAGFYEKEREEAFGRPPSPKATPAVSVEEEKTTGTAEKP